jgi:predicted transcriptional regulator of viral defense system
VVEHVQRGLDAGACLVEVEVADDEADVVRRVPVELPADLRQRPREEDVLDQPAHVVVDVDAERVRLIARAGVLDHHAEAVVEGLLGHQRRSGRMGLPQRRRPARLCEPTSGEPVGRGARTAAMRLPADGGECPQRRERGCRTERLERVDEAREEHRLDVLSRHRAGVPRADQHRGPLLGLQRVRGLAGIAGRDLGHAREQLREREVRLARVGRLLAARGPVVPQPPCGLAPLAPLLLSMTFLAHGRERRTGTGRQSERSSLRAAKTRSKSDDGSVRGDEPDARLGARVATCRTIVTNMARKLVESRDRRTSDLLYELAEGQAGYLTARQAVTAGIPRSTLGYHAGEGETLERVGPGVYRLRRFPTTMHGHVVAGWIGLAPAGAVVSHASALEMLELSDVIADELHLTLPRAKRGLRIPPGVRAHFTTRPIDRSQRTRVLGVPVTSIERTLADQLRAVGWTEQIDLAVQQAVRRGLTSRARLETKLPATWQRRVAAALDEL